MDLSFAARGTRPMRIGALPAVADHRALLAALAAMQAACPGAMLAARLRVASAPADARAALTILLTAGAEWSQAAAALGGSFAPQAAAAIAGKARATLVKPHFTFAF